MGPYHPVVVHWMLNPGLAFNELVLGQVVPRYTDTCAGCTFSPAFGKGRYVQCGDCGAYHNNQVWEGANGFGNWLGMVCPDCGGTVPRVWNFLSLIVLTLTFPIWWLAVRLFGKGWRAHYQAKARKCRDALEAGTLESGAGPRVHALLASGQCPYCHDAVDSSEGVACASCLSRHHQDCWDEHKQCAACAATTRFTGIEETGGREPPPREGKRKPEPG